MNSVLTMDDFQWQAHLGLCRALLKASEVCNRETHNYMRQKGKILS